MDFFFGSLTASFSVVTGKQLLLYAIGVLLIYLAIRKKYEPALLLPMGFGAILVNLPMSAVLNHSVPATGEEINGVIEWLFSTGITTAEVFPLLLFIGVGAMIDFGPLLAKPILFLFGAAAHIGIFVTFGAGLLLGFPVNDAAAIGMIGAADGPTVILFSQMLHTTYLGPIMVAAYSYMALVPIIQPVAIKLVTTKKERRIRMDYSPNSVSRTARIVFPIMVTLVTGFIASEAAPLIGFLMFGNLIRECGVLNSLSETAQTVLANLITLLLGITVSFTMQAERFVTFETLLILVLGLLAFFADTIGGVLFAKILNLFLKKKINPMIGGCGISAFPMSARVVQKLAQEEDPQNIILMQAAGTNVSGQIASVIAGGVLLPLIGQYL